KNPNVPTRSVNAPLKILAAHTDYPAAKVKLTGPDSAKRPWFADRTRITAVAGVAGPYSPLLPFPTAYRLRAQQLIVGDFLNTRNWVAGTDSKGYLSLFCVEDDGKGDLKPITAAPELLNPYYLEL